MNARLIGAGMVLAYGMTSGFGAEPQQGSDDATRQIVAEEFLKARPVPKKPLAAKRPTYRPAASPGSTGSVAAGVNLGLTIWRLRPAQPSEESARLLVQDAAAADLTAERVDVGSPLAVGDRVRLSIESPNTGRLYVIDRELFADGTMGDPYLIFPTLRTRQGDNAVRAGRLIDIPDLQDRPAYFTVRPSRAGQLGEQLTLIVSRAPLEGLTVTDKPAVLPTDQVASWERSWGAPTQQFGQEGGAKRAWTREEQSAAADGTRLLTQDDPAPQTIFRVAAKAGSTVLVNVRLPYATAKQ